MISVKGRGKEGGRQGERETEEHLSGILAWVQIIDGLESQG